MKITPETKISDLIPEGYELNGTFGLDFTKDKEITISIKKKEVKDFDWYVKAYWMLALKRNIIDRNNLHATNLIEGIYRIVPFEIKIGLLKFICDDLNVDWKHDIKLQLNGWNTIVSKTKEICPKEFLESIF